MKKTTLAFIQGTSVRELISNINQYNKEHNDTPILKEDIVDILQRDESLFLLYYK